MKRSENIVQKELLFLKNLIDGHITEIEHIDQALDNGLALLASEQNIERSNLIQIILVNFKYSVLEAMPYTDLTFDFSKLTVKDICYFYFMCRVKNSSDYLTIS